MQRVTLQFDLDLDRDDALGWIREIATAIQAYNQATHVNYSRILDVQDLPENWQPQTPLESIFGMSGGEQSVRDEPVIRTDPQTGEEYVDHPDDSPIPEDYGEHDQLDYPQNQLPQP